MVTRELDNEMTYIIPLKLETPGTFINLSDIGSRIIKRKISIIHFFIVVMASYKGMFCVSRLKHYTS